MCGMCTVIGAITNRQSDNKGSTATSNNTSTKTASTVASGAAQKKAETAETKQARAAATVGTAVRDGKFEFVVKSMQCGAKQVGGEYLNKEAQTFFDANQAGFAGSAEYKTDSTATMYAAGDQSAWINEINPGNQIAGKIVFDVPATVKLNKLELHDSLFSGGVTVNV